MQANGLNESSILSIGTVLEIPPIEADPNPGSSFKIIPDSELVFGPASAQFDMPAFLQEQGGYLANYSQEVDGEFLSGDHYAPQNYSVNPRLLLALLEYRTVGFRYRSQNVIIHWFFDDYMRAAGRLPGQLITQSLLLLACGAISSLPLTDGTYAARPDHQYGTAGIQYFLSSNNRPSGITM
jgi:hypothetical protein